MHPHHHGHHHSIHGTVRLQGTRAKRGDVQAGVMALLNEQDMHGYQMIQELSERSGGAWNPSPGSIYPALQALEQHGMVSSTEAGGKRVFSLTELGRKHAAMLPRHRPWEEIAEDSDASHRLRDVFRGLTAATSQVASGGDDGQIARAADILADARKRIYMMLANDE